MSDIDYVSRYSTEKEPRCRLWVEGFAVAYADSQEKLAIYQRLHSDLIERFSSSSKTKELAELLIAFEDHDNKLSADFNEIASRPVLLG
ncbi:MAG: hypothetical protein NTX46_05180 [Chloroflexi bacterium]|nr:hypothetical protein [Chloroflexota bacterium]